MLALLTEQYFIYSNYMTKLKLYICIHTIDKISQLPQKF